MLLYEIKDLQDFELKIIKNQTIKILCMLICIWQIIQ